jgi:hypothetical protein
MGQFGAQRGGVKRVGREGEREGDSRENKKKAIDD